MDSALSSVLGMFPSHKDHHYPLAMSMNALIDTRKMTVCKSISSNDEVVYQRFIDDNFLSAHSELMHTYEKGSDSHNHSGSGTMDFLEILSVNDVPRAFIDVYNNTKRSLTVLSIPSLYRINFQNGVSSDVDIPLSMSAQYGDANVRQTKQYALLAVT
jgi:hypothetical protein